MASGREWRGGQNQVRLLARELARAPGVAQRLVTGRDSELAHRAAADGVTVRPVPWTWGLDPRAWWTLVGECRRDPPAILHAHDSHALRLALWARAVLARRDTRRPPRVVGTRRVDFHVRPRSGWHRADAVVAISKAVRNVLIRDGVPAARVHVVPSGIDPAEVRRAAAAPFGIRPRLGLAPDTPVAVNVAALVPHKDHLTLLAAAAAARDRLPTLHWVVAGEGKLRGRLEMAIRRLGLGDRVHLLGYVREVDALIGEADVFVMSSREEGLGTAALHALALGRPVVSTAAGGLPEIVPPEYVVPVGDAAALAHRLGEVLAHPRPTSLPQRYTATAMAVGVLAAYRAVA